MISHFGGRLYAGVIAVAGDFHTPGRRYYTMRNGGKFNNYQLYQ
jgi:hypothetical protein